MTMLPVVEMDETDDTDTEMMNIYKMVKEFVNNIISSAVYLVLSHEGHDPERNSQQTIATEPVHDRGDNDNDDHQATPHENEDNTMRGRTEEAHCESPGIMGEHLREVYPMEYDDFSAKEKVIPGVQSSQILIDVAETLNHCLAYVCNDLEKQSFRESETVTKHHMDKTESIKPEILDITDECLDLEEKTNCKQSNSTSPDSVENITDRENNESEDTRQFIDGNECLILGGKSDEKQLSETDEDSKQNDSNKKVGESEDMVQTSEMCERLVNEIVNSAMMKLTVSAAIMKLTKETSPKESTNGESAETLGFGSDQRNHCTGPVLNISPSEKLTDSCPSSAEKLLRCTENVANQTLKELAVPITDVNNMSDQCYKDGGENMEELIETEADVHELPENISSELQKKQSLMEKNIMKTMVKEQEEMSSSQNEVNIETIRTINISQDEFISCAQALNSNYDPGVEEESSLEIADLLKSQNPRATNRPISIQHTPPKVKSLSVHFASPLFECKEYAVSQDSESTVELNSQELEHLKMDVDICDDEHLTTVKPCRLFKARSFIENTKAEDKFEGSSNMNSKSECNEHEEKAVRSVEEGSKKTTETPPENYESDSENVLITEVNESQDTLQSSYPESTIEIAVATQDSLTASQECFQRQMLQPRCTLTAHNVAEIKLEEVTTTATPQPSITVNQPQIPAVLQHSQQEDDEKKKKETAGYLQCLVMPSDAFPDIETLSLSGCESGRIEENVEKADLVVSQEDYIEFMSASQLLNSQGSDVVPVINAGSEKLNERECVATSQNSQSQQESEIIPVVNSGTKKMNGNEEVSERESVPTSQQPNSQESQRSDIITVTNTGAKKEYEQDGGTSLEQVCYTEVECNNSEICTQTKYEEMESYIEAKCEGMESGTEAKYEEMESCTKAKCEEIDSCTEGTCEKIESCTEAKCEEIESRTEAKCEEIESRTEAKCEETESCIEVNREEIDVCTEAKREEIDSCTEAKCVEIESCTEAKHEEIDSYTEAKCKEIESRTEAKCEEVKSCPNAVCEMEFPKSSLNTEVTSVIAKMYPADKVDALELGTEMSEMSSVVPELNAKMNPDACDLCTETQLVPELYSEANPVVPSGLECACHDLKSDESEKLSELQSPNPLKANQVIPSEYSHTKPSVVTNFEVDFEEKRYSQEINQLKTETVNCTAAENVSNGGLMTSQSNSKSVRQKQATIDDILTDDDEDEELAFLTTQPFSVTFQGSQSIPNYGFNMLSTQPFKTDFTQLAQVRKFPKVALESEARKDDQECQGPPRKLAKMCKNSERRLKRSHIEVKKSPSKDQQVPGDSTPQKLLCIEEETLTESDVQSLGCIEEEEESIKGGIVWVFFFVFYEFAPVFLVLVHWSLPLS